MAMASARAAMRRFEQLTQRPMGGKGFRSRLEWQKDWGCCERTAILMIRNFHDLGCVEVGKGKRAGMTSALTVPVYRIDWDRLHALAADDEEGDE